MRSFQTIIHNNNPEIFQKYPPPLSPTDIGTNHQACLADTQMSNKEKVDDIGHIVKANIAHIEMEEARTTNPMVILREKVRCR